MLTIYISRVVQLKAVFENTEHFAVTSLDLSPTFYGLSDFRTIFSTHSVLVF